MSKRFKRPILFREHLPDNPTNYTLSVLSVIIRRRPSLAHCTVVLVLGTFAWLRRFIYALQLRHAQPPSPRRDKAPTAAHRAVACAATQRQGAPQAPPAVHPSGETCRGESL